MTDKGTRIESGEVSAEFDPSSGRFDIAVGGFSLTGLTAGLEVPEGAAHGDQLAWNVTEQRVDRLVADGAAGALTLQLSFRLHTLDVAGEPTDAVTLSATVSSGDPFTLERIVLLQSADALDAPEWFFLNGASMSVAGSTPAADVSELACRPVCGWTAGGKTLFFTFPMHQPLPANLSGRVEAGKVLDLRAECTVELDDIEGSVAAAPLTIGMTGRPHDYIEAYGDRQRTPDMRPVGKTPIAWNSWDYILDLVSEDYILEHLDFIAADPVLRKHIEYIVVDAGWQHLHGDWEPNFRFPHGMGWLAGQITDRGFRAGIWFCPSVFENCSEMAYWNHHLAARGKSGHECQAWQGMRRYGLVLDIRNPDGRKWLGDLFARYRRMGYTYFKLDYLRPIMNACLHGGKRVAKGDLVREVVETVRDAVGDECHLMGCNYAWESGPGVVDSNRVSGDIRPRWEFIRKNARSIASRYWTHGRLWCADPDFALVRGKETSDDPDLERMHNMNVFWPPEEEKVVLPVMSMTLCEARTLASLVLLSGGSVTLSDCLPKLNERGLDIARKLVSAEIGQAGRPVDLFEARDASLWVQKLDSGGMRIGAINWTDEPAERTLDVRGLTGGDWASPREYWTDEPFTIAGGNVTVRLKPHETKLLVLRDRI